MSNRIIIDLETQPRPESELLALMPEFEAPGNYKDPVAIAKAVEAKRQAWLERAALSAETGCIVAVGYITLGMFCDNITDEATMLRSLWSTIESAKDKGYQIIGFNIAGFDIPYAIRRSWILGVPVPRGIYKGRYLNGDVFIDLMEVWCCGNREDRISLKRLAQLLGVGTKNEDNSKDFGKLLLNNRAEAIKHLENDLRLTEAIADRLLGPQAEKRAPGIMSDYKAAMEGLPD